MTDYANASELIQRLRSRGAQLWEEQGKLNYRAPQGVVTPADLALLKAQKAQVLALLAAEQQQRTLTADVASRYESFPLSQVQAAYLVGRNHAFGYGGVACHVYLEVNYPPLEHERLCAIWNELVARHDMLRAVFDQSGSQRILPEVPELTIPKRVGDADGAERLLDDVKLQMGHRQYQPENWPLFSLNLSQLPERSVLHLSMDFLIADWASIWLLLGEFEARYQQPDQPLPALNVTFRDYLLAERGQEESAAARRDREWWQARIPQLPAAPQLPVLDAQDEPAHFTRRFLQLAPARWRALKHQAAQCSITPTAAVLTAYASVLQRWSASDHFCLNLTVLKRQPLHEQVDRLVGDFTSVSLLEIDQRQLGRWVERATAISQQLYDDLDHRLCSGVEVMRDLSRTKGRDYAFMPYVFTSAIGLVPVESEKAAMGKLDGRGITQTPQVFIDCQAMDSAAGLQVNWDVREGVFPPGMIDDLFACFESLLTEMAEASELWQQPAQLALPKWQREQRDRINHTYAPLPEGGLHLPFFAQVQKTPEALAVADSQQQLTYRQLADAALKIAGHLQQCGVKPGERVAITLEKGGLQAQAVLGAMAAGAVWIPLDVMHPVARRQQILNDAAVRWVLTSERVTETGVSVEQRINIDTLNYCKPLALPHHPKNTAAAYIIYTSGSTGQPKGVVMGHQAALNTIEDINRRFNVGENDRVLALAQLGFDLAIYDLFGLLSVGGAIIYPDAARATDPSHWIDRIETQHVTLWNSVPALMQMLESALTHQPLSCLRLALLSGDWIPLSLPETLAQRLPQLQLIALGGATEAAIWSVFHRWQGRDASWRSVPYGLPLANQGFRVLDQKSVDCPVWVPGDLYISGVGLAQGYLNDAQKTEQHFIAHPADAERLYRTGDRACYLPNGELEFLGRADHQLKINGHRIEPGEIETALSMQSGVDQACVVPHGEGNQRQLLAVVTAKQQPAIDADYDRINDDIDTATAALTASVTQPQVERAMAALDSAVIHRLHTILQHYGLSGELNEATLNRTAIHPRFFWLVRRWQALTANVENLPEVNWQQVEALWQPLLDSRTFLNYIHTHLDNLSGLLEGQINAQSLLFPQGELTNVQALYRENMMAKYLNKAVSTLIGQIVQQNQGNTPLRILEVGAGTGGTTEDVLAMLANRDINYHFTDVAAFFLPEAKARFGDRAGMHFGLLNIDDAPRAQGYQPESFDIVLAAGVLENARDQKLALEHIRLLMAPQGWVILTEPTRECPWIMATQAFMMTPPEDVGRQQTSYLDEQDWQTLMQSVNCDPVLCLPQQGHVLAHQGFHLLAQQIKRDRYLIRPEQLHDTLSQTLPRYMLPAQIQCVPTLPLTANGKTDRKAVASWWVDATEGDNRVTDQQVQGDTLEQLLSQHWAEALGVSHVGLDQDVYNLGADSLIMARMAGKLRNVLAEAPWEKGDIPFDALLRHMLNGPTVRALAQAIRTQHTAVQTEPVADDVITPAPEQGRSPDSNGILLPAGGGTHGPLRVVFHAGLGTMDCFRPMLAELDNDPLGPVVGIVIADTAQYCALKPEEAVEGMADDYARRLLATGHNRFQLIGYCLGGLFAVEVARRLSEQRAEIADLVLISSHPVLFKVEDDLMIESLFIPNLHISLTEAGFGEIEGDALVEGFMQVINAHQGRIPAGALAQLPGIPGQCFQMLQALPIEERFARYVAGVERVTGQSMPVEMALGMFRVFRQSFHAAYFTPDVYVGDIRFLLPNQGSGFAPGMDENTLNFWREVCLGELQVTAINGNHFSCIEASNAQDVARLVNEGLQ